MANRIVDPNAFAVEAAIIDWRVIARTRRDGEQILKLISAQKLAPRTVHLRWNINPSLLGMPTEPFRVWFRPSAPKALEKDLAFDTLPFIFGYRAISWGTPMSSVTVQLNVGGPSAIVMAVSGAPTLEKITTFANVGTGSQTITLFGQALTGLLISGTGISITSVRGVPSDTLAAAADWKELEVVGLPVIPAEWANVGDHAQPQGMVTALTDPRTAARQRLERGTPPVGWQPELSPGVAAPVWQAPDPAALIDEMQKHLLPPLHGAMVLAPIQQLLHKLGVNVPPPANDNGDQMSGGDSTAEVAPLGVALMGAATDPFISLVLGFGTAFPDPSGVFGPNEGPFFDYMVTARYAKGVDGLSDEVEYAAFAPRPPRAVPPPPPANMNVEHLGYLRPAAPDGSWVATAKVNWERLPKQGLVRVGSFGAARASLSPAGPSEALMEPRESGGFKPIAGNASDDDPDKGHMHAVDRALAIAPNPGMRSVRYGVATQNIFGLWSPWVTADHTRAQLDLEPVRIVSAELRATPAGSPLCPATLILDFMWDWRVRRPQTIRLVGKLYPATHRGQQPPDALIPAGLQRTLGGAEAALDISFSGDTASAPGASIQALTADGEQQVAFGPAQGDDSRRYRVTLPGFALNFAATGHVGVALWARCTERVAPNRVGPFASQPYLTAASDPRPPVITIEHVQLASLPDASGQCHARISWGAAPGAVGYFIYESTETKILSANGQPDHTPDQTLDNRLARVKQLFRANPSRREFTRRNATLLTGTSADVTIPRGTTAIHIFVVLGVSAGQVEAQWPGGLQPDDALIALAAPRVMSPAAPSLEVLQVLDRSVLPPVYKAKVAVRARPGPRVQRVELFRVRVDDAARELDTMGPPVAVVSASGGGWTATQATDTSGTHLVAVDGTDAPNGSWKRVWYRAVAWSGDDPTHGALRGRSTASPAVPIVIPPPTPPDLAPITMEWPGGAPGDVLLRWTSSAPVAKTPLGAHRLSIEAVVVGAPPGTAPLLASASDLHTLGAAAPGSGSGMWRATDPPTGTVEYRALLRRAAETDVVAVAVRLTDPLGRTSEQLIQVPSGSVAPAPDIADVTLTPVAGKGLVLTWTSAAPIVATSAGAYRLTLIAIPKSIIPPIAPPSGGGGPFTPRPGPVIQPRFPLIRPIVIDMALGDILPLELGGFPTGTEPLIVRRLKGGGLRRSYGALCRVAVQKLTIRITAPDGRVAEETREVT